MENTIIRLPQLKKLTGLSRSSIYAMIKNGQFPKQVALGPRAVGWLSSDIQGWIAQRVAVEKAK